MKTVYMLDDDVIEIKIAEYMLYGGTSCEFFGTTDYNELMSWSKKHLPDIFLIDLVMPLKSGYEVIKQLYESFNIENNVKIILLTGFNDPMTLRRIQKTFNIKILDKDSNSCYEDILCCLNENKLICV